METKKGRAKKPSDGEQVADYMAKLDHPLKAAIEVVRSIIKEADPRFSERIKWNAPSYYYKADLLTFHIRPTDRVHLVFHHATIVQVQSDLLEGDYKDRRMVYFRDMADIEAKRGEFIRILKAYVDLME
ncbi:MAG TPA: DUF1801 domain-containing protein [Flavilitoribacter sp.]|nr:DUF1801 domain-containing protein [Flavilitoribacter sp.]HMQ89251.1 DUF1801 domain-containing protein [Flavilitoribacter sp.]